MRRAFYDRGGQSFIEYSMLIIIISAALLTMYHYIQRSINARLKQIQTELTENKR